jgi:hypothetical protein
MIDPLPLTDDHELEDVARVLKQAFCDFHEKIRGIYLNKRSLLCVSHPADTVTLDVVVAHCHPPSCRASWACR